MCAVPTVWEAWGKERGGRSRSKPWLPTLPLLPCLPRAAEALTLHARLLHGVVETKHGCILPRQPGQCGAKKAGRRGSALAWRRSPVMPRWLGLGGVGRLELVPSLWGGSQHVPLQATARRFQASALSVAEMTVFRVCLCLF